MDWVLLMARNPLVICTLVGVAGTALAIHRWEFIVMAWTDFKMPRLGYQALIVGLAVSTCACVAYAYTQTSPPTVTPGLPATKSNPELWYGIAALIVGFLSTISLQVFKILEDRRKRQADVEDRAAARQAMMDQAELARQELITRAEILRRVGIQTAVELAKRSVKDREVLVKAITDNTNLTIESGARMSALLEGHILESGQIPRLEDIAAVGEDTNEKVTHLQEIADTKKDKPV